MAADPNEIIWDAPLPTKSGVPQENIIWDTPAPTTTKPPEVSWGDWLGHKAQVVSNALSPYATAAGLGAAAGAPIGGVGAAPGAAAGIAALGLTDLATLGYNVAAPLWGGERIPSGSEAIRQQWQKVGVGEAPRTTGERILSATAEGAAGGLSNALAARQLSRLAYDPTTQRVLTVMGEQPTAQTLAGAGAAGSGQIASEAGLPWWAQLGATVAGGMAGGRVGAAKPTVVTPQDITTRAQNAYTAAEQSGVYFNPNSIATLGADARQALSADPSVAFHPVLHPRINVALNELDALGSDPTRPISFSRLEMARRIANEARQSTDKSERRLGYAIIKQIDDFVQKPPAGSVLGGDQVGAAAAIKDARTAWRQKSQSEILDTAIERASRAEGGLTSTNLRSQLRTIANNPNRLRQFDAKTQKAIKDFVSNKNAVAALQTLGKLTPGWSGKAALISLAEGVLAYGSHPYLESHPYLSATLAGTGFTAKIAANRLAKSRVTQMANELRGTPPREYPLPQVVLGTATQGARELEGQVFQGYETNPSGTRYPVYGYTRTAP